MPRRDSAAAQISRAQVAKPSPPMICLRWSPHRRVSPGSTLRGFMDLATPSGLVFRQLSVCRSDGRSWVVFPSRLKLNGDNEPLGIGDQVQWERLVEFRNDKARTRFNLEAIAALRRDFPQADV